METKFEKLVELFEKDTEAARKLLSCSAEEAVAVLSEQYNLEFTIDELNEVAVGIRAAMEGASNDELTDDQLEEVVGGGKSAAYNAGYYIGKVVGVAGAALGIVGGLVTIGVISW